MQSPHTSATQLQRADSLLMHYVCEWDPLGCLGTQHGMKRNLYLCAEYRECVCVCVCVFRFVHSQAQTQPCRRLLSA